MKHGQQATPRPVYYNINAYTKIEAVFKIYSGLLVVAQRMFAPGDGYTIKYADYYYLEALLCKKKLNEGRNYFRVVFL